MRDDKAVWICIIVGAIFAAIIPWWSFGRITPKDYTPPTTDTYVTVDQFNQLSSRVEKIENSQAKLPEK